MRTRFIALLLSLCASSPGPRRTRTAPARLSEQYVRVVYDQALRVPRCASPSPPPSPSSLLDSPLQTAHYVIFVLPRLQACSTPLPTVSHDLARPGLRLALASRLASCHSRHPHFVYFVLLITPKPSLVSLGFNLACVYGCTEARPPTFYRPKMSYIVAAPLWSPPVLSPHCWTSGMCSL